MELVEARTPDRVAAPGVGVREVAAPERLAPAPTPDTDRAAIGDDAELGGFPEGYADYGGNPAWLDHFVSAVLPCEGGPEWFEFPAYANGYVSAAQFAPGSWATAAAATGLWDETDPYTVGANVAWWSSHIEHPGGTGGWPVCWW